MDLTIEHKLDKATVRRRWRQVHFAFFAPAYAYWIVSVVILIICGLLSPYNGGICFALALGGLVFILSWYPRSCWTNRKLSAKRGAFDHPTVIHLTDTYMEVTCGENSSKSEYKILSGYMELKEIIVLVFHKVIVGALPKEDFPDGGKEFMQCLQHAGVKRIKFFGFKRWMIVCLPVLLVVFLGVTQIYIMANIQNRLWMREKCCRASCVSNLKGMMAGLLIYSDDQKAAGNIAIPKSLPVNEMIAGGYINGSEAVCPKLDEFYAYAPYNRLLDNKSSTAANTPVLWDFIVGCHWKKHGLLWGERIPQTVIVFEDQHVAIEDNLFCHKDIYDKYAPFMTKEDAEVLRKCCEEYDRIGY